MGCETSARESVAGIERDPKVGSEISGGSAANHLVPTDESESGGSGMGSFGGADYEFVENQIESEVGR
jgi:hypothetical protein